MTGINKSHLRMVDIRRLLEDMHPSANDYADALLERAIRDGVGICKYCQGMGYFPKGEEHVCPGCKDRDVENFLQEALDALEARIKKQCTDYDEHVADPRWAWHGRLTALREEMLNWGKKNPELAEVGGDAPPYQMTLHDLSIWKASHVCQSSPGHGCATCEAIAEIWWARKEIKRLKGA